MASKWSIASENSALSITSLGSIMSAASRGGVMVSEARSAAGTVRTAVQATAIAELLAVMLKVLLGGRQIR